MLGSMGWKRTHPLKEDASGVVLGRGVAHDGHGAFEMTVNEVGATTLDKL